MNISYSSALTERASQNREKNKKEKISEEYKFMDIYSTINRAE